MKEILLTIGMGLAGFLGLQADAPAQQENDDTIILIAEMSELDEQLWYARQANREEDFEEAIRLFEELEQSDSQHHRWAAFSGLATLYQRQYNIDAAREVANRAAIRDPESTGLMHIWKGDMAMQIKDYQKASQEYQLAEENYGQTIVNEMTVGEVALKQATEAAIQFKEPIKAAQLARQRAEKYPQAGDPEAALAESLLYEAMAKGEMTVDTLENVLYNGACNEERPCFISADKKLKNKDLVNKDLFEKVNNFSGLYFELEEKDKNVLENIKKVKEGDISLLESLIPKAQAVVDVSFTTCSVATESAHEGFSYPIDDIDINERDMFMTFPAAASTSVDIFHPGVDLNNWYDHVSGDLDDCSNTPADNFIVAAAGCVQETSTTNWGSLTVSHNYLPYNASYTGNYITSQYGHADAIFTAVGRSVAFEETVGSIGGVPIWPCHLHFEIREPDHPDPYDAGEWDTSYLSSQDSVGLYYEDPESFIEAHPAFTSARWVDEGSSNWDYTGSWTYVDTKGNGNDRYEDGTYENDLNYTSTTSSSTPDATVTYNLTASHTGEHNFYMFVPWSTQTKSDSVPVTLQTSDGATTLISDTLDFYGTLVDGAGTCDIGVDIDGDGESDYYYYSDSKRCDEWIAIGSADLVDGEDYELIISNNTGSDSDIIIIDDIFITHDDGSGVPSAGRVYSPGDGGRGGGEGLETADVCSVPSSGDWTVSADCSLGSDETVLGNVIINDGITLQLEAGVTLDMDLSTYHLEIGNGSRVMIEEGAKID